MVDLIRCYREGETLTPVVFVDDKEDDCLYGTDSEGVLREVYLNGFTVVSSQAIDYRQIVEALVKHFTLLITKVQFLDKNSTRIGSRESMVRAVVVFTGAVWLVVMVLMVLRRRYSKQA